METYEDVGVLEKPFAGLVSAHDGIRLITRRTDLFSACEIQAFGQYAPSNRGLGALQTAGLSTSVQLVTTSSSGDTVGRYPVSGWLEGKLDPKSFEAPTASVLGSGAKQRPEDLDDRVQVPHDGVTEGATGPSYASVIWRLVERQELRAARRLLAQLPDSQEYAEIRLLLRPPTTRPSRRQDVDRTAEYGWLRVHAREYKGRWIAVHGNALLASAGTLKELRMALNALELASRPLIHYAD